LGETGGGCRMMDHGCARTYLIRWPGGARLEARGGGDVTGRRSPRRAHALSATSRSVPICWSGLPPFVFFHAKKLPLTRRRSNITRHKFIHKRRCGIPTGLSTMRRHQRFGS
jgi:hypothetical protein